MKTLQDLPKIAPEMLDGLKAGPALRVKILDASRSPKSVSRPLMFRMAALGAGAVALAFGLTTLLKGNSGDSPSQAGTVPLAIHSAGDTGMPEGAQLVAILDVPQGSVEITSGNVPEFKSLFATISGDHPPLVGYNGHAYRMLASPGNLIGESLGQSLGAISLKTDEPALAGDAWSGLLSNVADEGSEVYAVSGLSTDTAIATTVDGNIRLFQRASYAGYGAGGGSLDSVLNVRGKVTSLSLSGVGTIEDPGLANQLMDTLLNNASFQNDDNIRSKQSLRFTLDNGLTLHLLVSGSSVSACGTWSCPEFFDAFNEALAQ